MTKSQSKSSYLDRYTMPMLLLALVAVLYGLCRVLRFDGLFGQDAYNYADYARQLQLYFQEGIKTGNMMPAMIYSLMSAVVSFVTRLSMGESMQLLSLLGFALTAYFTFLSLKFMEEGKGNKRYILLTLLCCPYFVRFAISDMTETTAMAAASVALYSFLKFKHKSSALQLISIFFFATLAIVVRSAMVVLLAPILVYCLFLVIQSKQYLHLILAVLAASVCLLPDLLIRQRLLFWDLHPSHTHAFAYLDAHSGWTPLHWFMRNFETPNGHVRYALPNILFYASVFFHPVFFLPMICMLWFFRKQDFRHFLWIPLIVYLLFLMGMMEQNKRFLLPLIPMLCLLCYPAFQRLLASLKMVGRYSWAVLFTLLFMLQLITAAITCLKPISWNKQERELAEAVNAYHPKQLYTFELTGAMKYRLSCRVDDLYVRPLAAVQDTAYLLFSEQLYASRWKGLSTMNNEQALLAKNHPQLLREFHQGWKLYRLHVGK
jgi:Alg9-like mannosyltransferase family